MAKRIVPEEVIGKKFHRLTVLAFAGRSKGALMADCECDCGARKIINVSNVIRGGVHSCGCLRREQAASKSQRASDANKTHGRSGESLYVLFRGMHARCSNPRHISFKNYGGKGIRVCERWSGENGFPNFSADMGPMPMPKHSIDRIDGSKDYCPENCRWATRLEQNRNTSANRTLTWNGRTLCISEWADETGLGRNTIAARIKKGWSDENVLATPSRNGKHITWNGQTRLVSEWAEIVGIPYKALIKRLFDGWTTERAITDPLRKCGTHGATSGATAAAYAPPNPIE